MGRSAKQAKQVKASKAAAKRAGKDGVDDVSQSVSSLSLDGDGNAFQSVPSANGSVFDEGKKPSTEQELNNHIARTTTGVLASIPSSRDIKIEQFSLQFYGQKLIENTTIELTMGRRYGLLGSNGSGKSTFLKALAAREAPIPEHVDIFLLNEEFPKTDMTALEAVVLEAKNEVKVINACGWY
jgi:ATP-binding cassette subfamily F protein 2